jgi:hypothetical protein
VRDTDVHGPLPEAAGLVEVPRQQVGLVQGDERYDVGRTDRLEPQYSGSSALFQSDSETDAPQTTPRKLALLTSSPLGLFGSRWEQLPA